MVCLLSFPSLFQMEHQVKLINSTGLKSDSHLHYSLEKIEPQVVLLRNILGREERIRDHLSLGTSSDQGGRFQPTDCSKIGTQTCYIQHTTRNMKTRHGLRDFCPIWRSIDFMQLYHPKLQGQQELEEDINYFSSQVVEVGDDTQPIIVDDELESDIPVDPRPKRQCRDSRLVCDEQMPEEGSDSDNEDT